MNLVWLASRSAMVASNGCDVGDHRAVSTLMCDRMPSIPLQVAASGPERAPWADDGADCSLWTAGDPRPVAWWASEDPPAHDDEATAASRSAAHTARRRGCRAFIDPPVDAVTVPP